METKLINVTPEHRCLMQVVVGGDKGEELS